MLQKIASIDGDVCRWREQRWQQKKKLVPRARSDRLRSTMKERPAKSVAAVAAAAARLLACCFDATTRSGALERAPIMPRNCDRQLRDLALFVLSSRMQTSLVGARVRRLCTRACQRWRRLRGSKLAAHNF